MNNTLYVVTAIFNPWRYKSRIELYNKFKKYIEDSGAKLMTVELAYNDRDFVVTSPTDPFNLQLRTKSELWHKERMLNLGMYRLPPDWEYVAWIDADVIFTRSDWVDESIQLLQHYDVIQMFSHAIDLGPKSEPIKTHTGLFYAYQEGKMIGVKYDHLHPGFAWAARRDALEKLGGLFDTAILGSADRHMACSLIDRVSQSHPRGISQGYIEQLDMWSDRCNKYIKRNVGYLPTTCMHFWHGRKKDRRYADRWKILVKHKYDPEFDLKFDSQGLYQFTDRCPELHYDIRNYMASRNEDSIDLE